MQLCWAKQPSLGKLNNNSKINDKPSGKYIKHQESKQENIPDLPGKSFNMKGKTTGQLQDKSAIKKWTLQYSSLYQKLEFKKIVNQRSQLSEKKYNLIINSRI